jgi:hypothetical protein
MPRSPTRAINVATEKSRGSKATANLREGVFLKSWLGTIVCLGYALGQADFSREGVQK